MNRYIDYYQDITKIKPEASSLIAKRVINSTCFFILGFTIATFLNHFISALSAKALGFSPVLTFYGVGQLPKDTASWDRFSILVVYASGPLFTLFFGLLLLVFRSKLSSLAYFLKALTLWIAFHCIVLFLSYMVQIVLGTESYTSPFYYGFSVIASWFWMGKILMSPFSFLGFVALLTFAYLLTPFFLELSSSASRIKNFYGKRAFVLQNIILPFVFGTIFLLIYKANKDFAASIVELSCSAIAVFVIWLRSTQKAMGLKIVKRDSLNGPVFLSIALLIALLLIPFFLFPNGISL